MTDLFAFPKPGDPAKSILIMDVHPSFSIAPDGVTTTEPFAAEALTDDVANVFLAILTNGKVYESGIGAHPDLLADFPYLGPPHRILPAGAVAP